MDIGRSIEFEIITKIMNLVSVEIINMVDLANINIVTGL